MPSVGITPDLHLRAVRQVAQDPVTALGGSNVVGFSQEYEDRDGRYPYVAAVAFRIDGYRSLDGWDLLSKSLEPGDDSCSPV